MEAKNGSRNGQWGTKKAVKRAKGKQEKAKERQVGPREGQSEPTEGQRRRPAAYASWHAQRAGERGGAAEGLCKSREKESNGKRKQKEGGCES